MEGCERGGRDIVLGVEGVHYKAGKWRGVSVVAGI